MQTIILVFIGVQAYTLRGQIAEVLGWYAEEVADERADEREEVYETIDEEEQFYLDWKKERQEAFDARIAQIKEELAQAHPPSKPQGHPAEILADGIVNLPHDSIIESNPPHEEYTL